MREMRPGRHVDAEAVVILRRCEPMDQGILSDPAARTLPAVPSWVKDPEKWVRLSRVDRRALERHHRREVKR